MKIGEYHTSKVLYQGKKSSLFRARKKSGEEGGVILKVPSGAPSTEAIKKLRREYEILQKLNDLEGVVKIYDFHRSGNPPFLVLEDFGAQSLSDFIESEEIDLEGFFSLALQLSEILAEIHSRHIIHRDIKPHNILIHPDSGKVKITDFGIASLLSREERSLQNPRLLEGTLAYMSPEQTGRMNRPLDYRSDFYSLGVTFYEILTGKRPFTAEDPLELVYAHLVQSPTPPTYLDESIPLPLSQVIVKMMAKSAEDRYKSALGLRLDLEECCRRWREGDESDFTPGQRDISNQFHLSSRLYGREEELSFLEETIEAFHSSNLPSPETKIILISGTSGAGKTALVKEILPAVFRRKGTFVSGKFDQFQQSTPYQGFIRALDDLMEQILSEEDEKIRQWRGEILKALGPNAQVMVDLVSRLEVIIGPQPPVPEVPPGETQNRFFMTFKKFINLLTSSDDPFILFLDDLQWAHKEALELLEIMIKGRQKEGLLIIGTYRDQEVGSDHPLCRFREEVGKKSSTSSVEIEEIKLTPLRTDEISSWIGESLFVHSRECRDLAAVVEKKTRGNPFFISQFLESNYRKGLIEFDQSQGSWQWDLEEISRQKITENVVDMLAQKIRTLSPMTRETLSFASCMGNRFDLKKVAVAMEKKLIEGASHLWETVREGMVVAEGNFPFFEDFREDNFSEEAEREKAVIFRFAHDRIRQAIYSQIDPDKRAQIHLKIGRIYRQKWKDKEELFAMVHQLNQGRSEMDSRELLDLARLNWQAGKKAKAALAYGSAGEYFDAGIKGGGEKLWDDDYSLALDLHIERAECEYLTNNFSQSERLFTEVLTRAKSGMDRARVYCTQVMLYSLQNLHKKALETGKKALEELSVRMAGSTGPLTLFREALKIKWKLRDYSIEDLENLPPLEDREVQLAFQILSNMFTPAILSDPPQIFLQAIKMMELSLLYGNSQYSSDGYLYYGMFLAAGLGNHKKGYEMGQLALKLNEEFDHRELAGKIRHLLAGFLLPWRKHVSHTFALFEEGHQKSMECGQTMDGGACKFHYLFTKYSSGVPLEAVAEEMEENYDLFDYYREKLPKEFYSCFRLLEHSIYKLQGRQDPRSKEEKEGIESHVHRDVPMSCFVHYLLCLMENFTLGKFNQCLQNCRELKEYTDQFVGQYGTIENYFFYHALTLLELYPQAGFFKKWSDGFLIARKIRQFRKFAQSCPENFLHLYHLLQAEWAGIKKNTQKALKLYEKSMEKAREFGFLQHRALASERAARLCRKRGLDQIASQYINQSYHLYRQWGAQAKVEQLKEEYSSLFEMVDSPGEMNSSPSEIDQTFSTTSRYSSVLDIDAVLRATQSLSEEIQREGVIRRLMELLGENAGAQKCILLLKREGSFYVEAQMEGDFQEVAFPDVPLEDSRDLPLAIVHYVKRTGEEVLLEDACREGRFGKDPYILEERPRSVLSLPVKKAQEVSGILYLENNLVAGAFTHQRLETLKILATQAAISLENAIFYEKLEGEIEERRRMEREILEISDRERRRLGRELHDDLGQHLAGVGLMTKNLAENLAEKLPEEAERADQINGYIKEARQKARTLAHSFNPLHMGEEGLVDSLTGLALQIEKMFSITCDFQCLQPIEAEGISQITHIYRIVQEAVHNAVKHGKAKKIEIRLEPFSEGKSILKIRDKGRGFGSEALESGGMGLEIMRYRARMMEADLEIVPHPEGGVQVSCIFSHLVKKKAIKEKKEGCKSEKRR